MYRVVIIDDASIIVKGLQRVVDWPSYHCQVVGTTYDSVSGAEAIRKYRLHIVFTDIKMPGDDGLTMLAGLKGEFPRMQITVLTGYRDFEYAQTAIRLGVARFLLKPSKMDELEEAVAYMTSVLDQLPGEEAEDPCTPAETPANSFLARQVQGSALLRHSEFGPCPEGQGTAGEPRPAHQRDCWAGGICRHRPFFPNIQKAGGHFRRRLAEPTLRLRCRGWTKHKMIDQQQIAIAV